MNEPKPAKPDVWRLYADGASRGNPGPSAAGFVLDDPAGNPVASAGLALGRATNNVAEYRALLEGLAHARGLGVERLEVRMDSELVVRQMRGEYKVKSPGLRPLYEEALRLAQSFRSFAIAHVPRDENWRADLEANRVLDASAVK